MSKNVITPREIKITSDDGIYTIKSIRRSLQDGYSYELGTYKGSSWTGVIIEKNGVRVNGIQVMQDNYQPFIHFGVYGGGMLTKGMALTKDVILYGAYCTGMFTKALEGIDCKKIEKEYNKAYWSARIQQEKNKML